MLSRSWSTTVPKTMLVSGIAQSSENMALNRSAKLFCPRHNSKIIQGILLNRHIVIKDIERKCRVQEL